MKKRYNAYVHMDKSEAYYYNEEHALGMDEDSEAFNKFRYSLYEVELNMEVDTDTGESYIIGIEGVKLEKPVRG
jgi:hypothetical protein